MNTKKIDFINILLIFISLYIAIKIPFKLFLFSYAILGPLHYLTEINWLKKKKYFIRPEIKWINIYVLIAFLLSIYSLVKLTELNLNSSLEYLINYIVNRTPVIILTGFLFSISLIFFKKTSLLLISLFLSFVLSILLSLFLPIHFAFFALFIPTIIHVYFFTLLFMVYGSIKSKSNFGFISIILLLLVPFFISFMSLNTTEYIVSKETLQTFSNSNMKGINIMIAKSLGIFEETISFNLSNIGIRIQIFVAFAYTYHYLNWFSKTSVIGWKNSLSKRNIILILFIWILSISIYAYDYITGFIALFFLSYLHVFMEFPLNITSIKEIFLFIKKKG